jgi:2-dehydro-3-deoxy-D-arabinonate dehydratase
MRLGQIKSNNQIVAAIFEGELALPIPNHTVCDLIRRSEAELVPLTDLATRLADPPEEVATPLIPIYPCEVWACGCTYQTSATFRDAECGYRESFYLRSNPVPAGSVLLTGTGIIITEESALAPGDIVSLQVPEIGELSNVARLV